MRKMKKTEYREAYEALDLSQGRAAKLIGMSHRAVAGYARGEYPIPPPVAIVMRLLVDGTIKPKDIERVMT
jgi:predicted transcriptional regulator